MDDDKITPPGQITGNEYDWKTVGVDITINDPAIYEILKGRIERAEAAMLNGLQADMFPPLTPEEEAQALERDRERRRPINRLRAWLNKWRWRLSDAWDVLRGKAIYQDYEG